MHGVMGKPRGAATDKSENATSRLMLLLLVAMMGVAPISLYMLVPALPVLATAFGRDVSIAQMTVPLNIAIVVLSMACASTMIFLVPRRDVVISEELIEQAEEEDSGML